jgi:hypothetical protein
MGGGVGEAALIGAALGAGGSAVTGGDPLKGALIGAATGGVGGYMSSAGASALGGASGAAGGAGAAGAAGAGVGAMPFAQAPGVMGAFGPNLASSIGAESLTNAFASPMLSAGASGLGSSAAAAAPSLMSDPMAYLKANAGTAGISGLMGTALSQRGRQIPGATPYTGQLSRFRYDPGTYRPQTMAGGGITSLGAMVPAPSPYSRPLNMRSGGISDLGSYSDGGRLLKGPGDGMSDSIPATIAGKRPARLAEGEFVVPADVVSAIGNGSTDAGARELYAMMRRARLKRTGKSMQAKAVAPQKYMPV